MSTKDLKYYLAHPDEMPTDPKEIERLGNEHIAQALESGTEQMNVDNIVGKQDEIVAESSTAKAEDAKPEAEKPAVQAKAEPDKPAEAKPDGILAKDGKNVIPYSQLESARARATAAETLAASQAEELARLKAASTTDTTVATDTEMLTEDELAVLEADSPTLAKTLRAQQAAIQKLTGTVESLTNRAQEETAQEAVAVKSEIQQAIDANPTLAAWQADKDQTLWEEAYRFDKLLRESPKYADVPFADRFAKVVELTQTALGLEVKAPTSDVVPSEVDVKAVAAAKLAEKQKAARPTSLSQIPGGAPPAVDERDKVEQMSPVALGQAFLGMSKEQMETYLASL